MTSCYQLLIVGKEYNFNNRLKLKPIPTFHVKIVVKIL